MSPEKIIEKTKSCITLKGVGMLVAFSFALGGAAYKLDNTQKQLTTMGTDMKEMHESMLAMQKGMYTMQKSIALTQRDIAYIVDDISKLTAEVGEKISNTVKIRRE